MLLGFYAKKRGSRRAAKLSADPRSGDAAIIAREKIKSCRKNGGFHENSKSKKIAVRLLVHPVETGRQIL